MKRTTSRLGVALTVLCIVALDILTPGRYRITPVWLLYVAAAASLGSMIAARLSPHSPLLRRVERIAMMATIGLLLLANSLNLLDVLDEVVFHSGNVQAMPLIYASLAIWCCNMLAFALLYWEIDRGGPDARASDSPGYPDFDFPAYSDPSKVPAGWQPGFVDYLFIGFTTTTAFGPTEAMPLTARAKLLIMAQSIVSLITIVVIAARAIGIIQ
ncbi:MAG TPA: hypothetical protein VMT95_15675 [Candidatus Binatia bacterium]|nr:hypothetical protein [Candidatus Binatia bacterium]